MTIDRDVIKNQLIDSTFDLNDEELLKYVVSDDELSELLINYIWNIEDEEALKYADSDDDYAELLKNTILKEDTSIDFNDPLWKYLDIVVTKKLAIIPNNFTSEEKEKKLQKIKERVTLLQEKYKEPVIWHIHNNNFRDFINLDEENFKKVLNIIDNSNSFNLNDFNGTVISIDQLSFPRKENNKHKVRIFNEIVDAHKKSICSNNKEEDIALYNNLLLFLELGIDKNILGVINGDIDLKQELKNKGYIDDENQEIDVPTLIEIVKRDIENTKGDKRYNFLHKITDLYIEKERTNYVNNGFFEYMNICTPVDINIYNEIKKGNYSEVIQNLVNANSYVETDEVEVDEIVNSSKSDIEKIRELNTLYKKNYEEYRIFKNFESRREVQYELPYTFNEYTLKTVLQNDIISRWWNYKIEVDGKLMLLHDFLVDEIIKQDSNDNTLGDNKVEKASDLLSLYIERIRGLSYEDKKDYDLCIEEITKLIGNKEIKLLVDGKEYDEKAHENTVALQFIIKNTEKKKKNYIENAEKEIGTILINDIINNYQKYGVRNIDSDLSLAKHIIEVANNTFNEDVSIEVIKRKVLENLNLYGKDDRRLDSLDKKILKIIKEEVSKLYDGKNSLYQLENNIDYDRDKVKESLGLDTYLERLITKKENEISREIKEDKILDIFKNCTKYAVQIGEQRISLYDYLLEKIKKGQTVGTFNAELSKILRLKNEFEDKKLIKTLNDLFKDIIPLGDNNCPKFKLYFDDEPYNLEKHIDSLDEMVSERIKEYHINDVEVKINLFDIISQTNIEELKKKLLEDEEAYNSFMKLLESKKFLTIPLLLEKKLKNENFNNTPESMATFITHYKEIIDREKKKAKNRGTIFSETSLSIPRIIDLGIAETALNSKYRALFGKEDTLYLYKDPELNSSTAENKETRLALGVYYLLSNYQRQYVTAPSFEEEVTIEDGYDKKMNVICGNFSNTNNITLGERTDSCMRIKGAGRRLFNFCLSNENGFHIIFEDPETHDFISRVSGFRNGNTVVLNELRESYNDKYDTDEVIKVLYKVARMLIEKTKDDEYPIQNVFVGPDEAFSDKYHEEEDYDVDNIQEGFIPFYLNSAEHGGILLATTKEPVENEKKFEPIKVGPENAKRYEVQRVRVREYTNNEEVAEEYNLINTISFEQAKEKILMIETAKKLMEQGEIPLLKDGLYEDKMFDDMIKTVEKAVSKLEIEPINYEIKYAAVGDDFYIVLDKDNNIHSNFLNIPNDKAKEERNAMIDRVKNICSSITRNEAKQEEKTY